MGAHSWSGRRLGHPGTQGGLAYLVLLVALAVIGTAAAHSVGQGAAASRRQAELDLLAIGTEFEHAFQSHRLFRAAGPSAGPREIEELLLDRRVAGLRHLRKIYVDPLTGRQEWGVLRHPDGSIMGLYSMAPGIPIKRSGFGLHRATFDDGQQYSQWVFRAPP